MKIIVDRSRSGKLIKVKSARYLKDFVIRIAFDDNEERLVDFKPFLSKASHPEIAKYLKESNFKKFKVEGGNINWNDYELIFPIEHLYQGLIK